MQAAPILQPAEEEVAEDKGGEEVDPSARRVLQVADSDAESDGGPAPPLRDSDVEPLASEPKRKKRGIEKKEKATPKKKAAQKKRPASTPQPERRVRGKKVASPASALDVD